MQQNRTLVYVWEFPVRFTHWINALCVFVLSYTGYYIAHPFMHAVSSQQYVMGWMRFIHFVSGYLLLVGVVIRLYWAFAGNRYANWQVLVPLEKRQWRDMREAAKFYFFMKKEKEPPYSVGHAPLASLCYLVVLLLFLFEIFSGFALYSQSHLPNFFLTLLGGWLLGIMHVQTIRLWHHLVMYFLLAFTLFHVYIAWFLDSVEKNGVMGSIFGGYKFVTGKEWE
jgi:Ni/Fe-hydrogenase 1 B-type cytochrome subunit